MRNNVPSSISPTRSEMLWQTPHSSIAYSYSRSGEMSPCEAKTPSIPSGFPTEVRVKRLDQLASLNPVLTIFSPIWQLVLPSQIRPKGRNP